MHLSTINKFGCFHSPYKNMRFKGRYYSLKKGLRKKSERKENYGKYRKFYDFISNLRPSCNKYASWIARRNNQEILR